MLYCLKHKVFANKRHPCNAMELITITKECKPIADGLYDFVGIGPLSVAHFVTPVADSLNKFYINVCVDLARNFQIQVLGDMPNRWRIHTETISDDKLPLLVIGYHETFTYDGVKTVNTRVLEIIKEFVDYLGTKDKTAVRAVLKLDGYEIDQ